MICLSLTESTIEENLLLLEKYRPHVGITEIRGDYLRTDELRRLKDFPRLAGLPVILTLRRVKDGGKWEGREAERLALYRDCLDAGYACFDLEEDLPCQDWESRWRARGRIIRSFHDFQGVPAGLSRRFLNLPRNEQEIPKAAVMPRSSTDLITLFKTAGEVRRNLGADRPWLLLGMGDFGFATRVLAGWMGCWFTFTSGEGRSAAPGHIDPARMETLYRYSRITRETPLYGILGHPVMHTRSPEIHNRGLAAAGLPGVYLPFETDDPVSFLSWASEAGFRGFSVTVPHKEAVIPLLEKKDQSVEVIGACNTVFRLTSGGWGGVNTDAAGFIRPLLRRFPRGIAGMETAVIGAGGAARAVVYALVKEGARVTIYNRTVARAKELARERGCFFASLDELGTDGKPVIVIQTTSAGMDRHGAVIGEDPVPRYRFRGDETVFEIVYAPPRTPLLVRAEKAGCRIIGGMEMLEAQGWEQFKIFTGTRHPEEN